MGEHPAGGIRDLLSERLARFDLADEGGADDIERCKPIYETLPGWSDSTVGVTQYDKLPVAARLYLQRSEQVTGVPIHMVSTSPDRDHTIMMRHPYLAD